MSQASNSKSKDNGKKYTSLNLNQTFKGSKSEGKTSAGQNNRHGLQSLGKIGQSRRVLQPANLPSLKSENSGNDPRINLVPSGIQGWGKKESAPSSKQATSTASVGGSGSVTKAPSKPGGGQPEISLRPNAGVTQVVRVQKTSESEAQDAAKPTWVNKVQPQQPASGKSTYFHKEFPTLGGIDGKGEIVQERGPVDENGSDSNRQGMVHPMMMNQAKWIDTPQGPMPIPANFPPPFSGDQRPMFNGSQQYPYPYPPMYTAGGRNVPMPYPYPFYPGGKMPQMDPRFFQRFVLLFWLWGVTVFLGKLHLFLQELRVFCIITLYVVII